MIVYAVVAAVAEDIGPGRTAELERSRLTCRGRDQAGQLDGQRFNALFQHARAAGVPVEEIRLGVPAPDVAAHLPGGLRLGFEDQLPELFVELLALRPVVRHHGRTKGHCNVFLEPHLSRLSSGAFDRTPALPWHPCRAMRACPARAL